VPFPERVFREKPAGSGRDEQCQMTKITSDQVRQFLLMKYGRSIRELKLDPPEIRESFDFLVSGVIDSFGILEMVSSIEDEFRIG
jgi:hypothetical protein